MATRVVKGEVLHPSGAPWASGVVSFSLRLGSYTPFTQYPTEAVGVRCDSLGRFTTNLWINEEGDVPSYYSCRLPSGDSFNFVVPLGFEPIELSLLRQAGFTPTMASAKYTTLISYVQGLIAESSGSTGSVTKIQSAAYLASVPLSALRVVALNSNGQLVYADASDQTQANRIVGVTTTSAIAAATVRVLTEGTLEDNSWSWQEGAPIFCGTNGILTQLAPTTGFLKQVAIALQPKQIYIDLQETVIL